MDIASIRRTNLRLIIEENFGGVAADFARQLGRQPSEISRVFTVNPAHSRNIGSRFARQIERSLDKDIGWMDRLQPAIAITMRTVSVTQEDHLDDLAAAPNRRVPLVSSLLAGDKALSRQSFPPLPAENWVFTLAVVSERAYALQISGDSMEPKFPEGATIIVDPDVESRHGSFVVARFEETGEITLKQLVIDGRPYLKPLNPRYPILEMTASTTLCGVVRQLLMNFE